MKPLYLSAVISLFMIGCVTANQPIVLLSQFNAEKSAYILNKGNNTLTGQSFMKTRGGDVKTCAGNKVLLYPVTDYSTERIIFIYGNENAGFREYYSMLNMSFLSTDPDYHKYTRQTFCDAQGNFRFDNISDGEYYIIASVAWEVYNSGLQGGALMQKVTIANGKSYNIFVLGH